MGTLWVGLLLGTLLLRHATLKFRQQVSKIGYQGDNPSPGNSPTNAETIALVPSGGSSSPSQPNGAPVVNHQYSSSTSQFPVTSANSTRTQSDGMSSDGAPEDGDLRVTTQSAEDMMSAVPAPPPYSPRGGRSASPSNAYRTSPKVTVRTYFLSHLL